MEGMDGMPSIDLTAILRSERRSQSKFLDFPASESDVRCGIDAAYPAEEAVLGEALPCSTSMTSECCHFTHWSLT